MTPEREAKAAKDFLRVIREREVEHNPGARPDVDEFLAAVAADPGLVAVESTDVTISTGGATARLYRGAGLPTSALVWVHGGAFIGGDLDMPEASWPATVLASEGVAVLSIDYRKALNGVRHPIPGDDVLDAWRWAVAHLSEWAGGIVPLSLGGASAGASLAAGAVRRAIDGGEAVPASLLLLYPTLHAKLPTPSAELRERLATLADDRRTPAMVVHMMNRNLVGPDGDMTDTTAFPGDGSVHGLPPVCIINSDLDDFRASGEAFASTLRTAGIPMRDELEPGTFHGHLNTPSNDASRATIRRMRAWLSEIE